MARAGVAPAITPSGKIDSSGALPVAGGNPWRDPESTASVVTPGEDFARRPTAESPLAKFAELSELAQRPVVLLAGGGVVLLLLIVAVVLLLRSPVPNAGSIVEVKAPPRPAWKSDLPPDAPAPVAAPVAPPAPAPAPAPPPEPAPVVVAPPPPEVEEEPAPAPVPEEKETAAPPPRVEGKDKPEPKTQRPPKPRTVAKSGELRVLTTAAGKSVVAKVLVDGVEKGHTPLVLQVAAGKHEVQVSRPKGAPVSRSVRVTGEKPLVLKIELPE
jgi:outer membrane biosynthesis protein TonB